MHVLHGAPREDSPAPLALRDDDVHGVLSLDQPTDEREAVAFEFAHQASLDPIGVSDELRRQMAEHFTPSEVIEIAYVIGFWKMYNTIYSALHIPLEDPVLDDARWVNVAPHSTT